MKKEYEVQNRQPPETEVATFLARDLTDPSARLVYDMYEASSLPFRIDRYSGQLFTMNELNLPVGKIMPITLVATNLLNGQDVRTITTLKVTVAVNQFSPAFPSNGSTIFLQRNATASETIWIADTIDEDPDEVNSDIIYRVDSLFPEGFLEFIVDTGELKLLKSAKDFPDTPVNLVLTACNGASARPSRCSTAFISVAVLIPQAGALIDMLDDLSAEKMAALIDAVEIMSEYAKKDVKVFLRALKIWNWVGAWVRGGMMKTWLRERYVFSRELDFCVGRIQ